MAGDRNDHDERIEAALRQLDLERRAAEQSAADRGEPSALPDELWDRIAGALAPSDALDGFDDAPPPDLWGQIEAEVLALEPAPSVEHEVAPTLRPVAAGDVAPSSAGDAIPAPVRLRRPRPLRRTLGLVAAAVLAVVALGFVVARAGDGPGGSSTELIASADLTGEGIQPGGTAVGSAELLRTDDDWEVAIEADELPAVAPGEYYEAWLLGEGPNDVQSLGAIDATGTFAVPAGLDLADFPLVDVSIEAIDGDPSHSAQSVLRGRLETL